MGETTQYVNGIVVGAICSQDNSNLNQGVKNVSLVTQDYDLLLENVDAVYIVSHPEKHYFQVKKALEQNKHVLCEAPLTLNWKQCEELFRLAKTKKCVLMEAVKTAYSTAYERLLLMLKGGKIGKVVSVDTVCTSLRDIDENNCNEQSFVWNSICGWGPTALLPIFQLLGTEFVDYHIVTQTIDKQRKFDMFTKIDFIYKDAVASVKVGKGVKSEGEMVISGTKGYVYVPSPWWKTDYFEVRYENPADNKRYFYQLDGEGIRYEILAFIKSIETGKEYAHIDERVTLKISNIMQSFYENRNVTYIE